MHIYYFSVMSSSSHWPWQWRAEKADNSSLTFGLALGLSCSSFLAAASMDAAAPSSSVSAITVGSSGSTHSEPEACLQKPKLKKVPPEQHITRSCQKNQMISHTKTQHLMHRWWRPQRSIHCTKDGVISFECDAYGIKRGGRWSRVCVRQHSKRQDFKVKLNESC